MQIVKAIFTTKASVISILSHNFFTVSNNHNIACPCPKSIKRLFILRD